MIVMKFGGTSVGVPDHFENAVRLVAERAERRPVLVVSALSGVTNLLVDYCRDAEGRPGIASAIEERHLQFCRTARLDARVIAEELDSWRLEAALHAASGRAIVGEPRDRVLAFGERLSAELFAAGLRRAGLEAAAVVAGDAGLLTDDRFGAAHPLPETSARLRRSLEGHAGIPVVTGF